MNPLNSLAGGFGSGLGGSFFGGGGGRSAPLLSENGDVSINQGGLNVPAYPAELIKTPIDRDVFDFIPTAKAQDLTVYYYAAAGFVLMLLLKKKK